MRRCVELDPERSQSCPFRGIAVQDPRSVVGKPTATASCRSLNYARDDLNEPSAPELKWLTACPFRVKHHPNPHS